MNANPGTAMKRLAALAGLALVTSVGSGPLVQAQTTTPRAETPSMSTTEFRRWQRNWDRRLADLFETDQESYAWGKEKRPVKSQVVVLDPPLVKMGRTDRVTVEWFFAPIDERNRSWAWKAGSLGVSRWATTVGKAGEDRIEFVMRPVSRGPGAHPRFERAHRLVQDMVYAWEENPWYGSGRKAYTGITETTTYLGTLTEEQARALIEQAGLDARVWTAKRKSPETAQRAELANTRYEEAMRQAAERSERYLETPQDPVLLIDGKYLLTGYVTRRTRNLFRMVNRIVRERIERMPQHAFDRAAIKWGNEHRPTRKELITLPGEERETDRIEIEWFFTYITDEGQATHVEWFDRVLDEWRTEVQIAGVRNIQIKRRPVAKLTPEGSSPWDAHREVHQQLVLGWSDESPGWRRQVHGMLPRFLAKNPRSMDTLEAGEAVLERLKLPVDQHREDLKTPERQGAIAGLNERILQIRSALPRKLRGKVVDPVLVVNGKYLIEAQTAGSVEKVFQILNWMVRRQLG